MQTSFTKILDINDLQSNLLTQIGHHLLTDRTPFFSFWAPFSNLSGTILYHVGRHFIAKKYIGRMWNFI